MPDWLCWLMIVLTLAVWLYLFSRELPRAPRRRCFRCGRSVGDLHYYGTIDGDRYKEFCHACWLNNAKWTNEGG